MTEEGVDFPPRNGARAGLRRKRFGHPSAGTRCVQYAISGQWRANHQGAGL